MHPVNKRHEIRGRSEAAGGRKVSQRLVSPGAVERMLHHGQEFHMRVAHPLHIRNELVGQFAVR